MPLEPNAPPTSGRITSKSRPSACLNAARVRYVSCAEIHTVEPSTTMPRGSIGAATVRGIECRARTTWAAAANAPSMSPVVLSKRTIGSGGVGGSSSHSTSTRSAASTAAARDSASTSATGWPT